MVFLIFTKGKCGFNILIDLCKYVVHRNLLGFRLSLLLIICRHSVAWIFGTSFLLINMSPLCCLFNCIVYKKKTPLCALLGWVFKLKRCFAVLICQHKINTKRSVTKTSIFSKIRLTSDV